jgi:hypothetical protein
MLHAGKFHADGVLVRDRPVFHCAAAVCCAPCTFRRGPRLDDGRFSQHGALTCTKSHSLRWISLGIELMLTHSRRACKP